MHNHRTAAIMLETLDLGSSIAELDNLLQTARVETSAFSDLLHDKVDLIPGTKGSGKSALFRIFTDFLPEFLLRSRKVVVAHGVGASKNLGSPPGAPFGKESHEFVLAGAHPGRKPKQAKNARARARARAFV